MKMEEMEITIDADGNVSMQVRGVTGKSCLELTKPLEEALGAEVENRTMTSEYYATDSSQKAPARAKTSG